jgi:hypothetical protein
MRLIKGNKLSRSISVAFALILPIQIMTSVPMASASETRCLAVGSIQTSDFTKATDMITVNQNGTQNFTNTYQNRAISGDGTGVILDCAKSVRITKLSLWTGAGDIKRDPTGWTLYGANSSAPINNWVKVGSAADINPPNQRFSSIGLNFSLQDNSKFFRYYKIVIDSVRGPNADLVEYRDVLLTFTTAIPCFAIGKVAGTSPANEDFSKATDGNINTKYLNSVSAGNNNGLIVDCREPLKIGGMEFVTGNDIPARDPNVWSIWGSNQNSLQLPANAQIWTRLFTGNKLTCGTITCGRLMISDRFEFENTLSFRFYKIVIDEVKGPNSDSTQYSELNLYAADPNFKAQSNQPPKSSNNPTPKPPATPVKPATTPTKKVVKPAIKKVKCFKGSIVRIFNATKCPAGYKKN